MRYLQPLLIALLAATGCKQFDTVDDACKDKVPGEKWTEPLDRAAIQRINCYRRVTGMAQMGFQEQLQEATVAHVEYVMANGGISDGTWYTGGETQGNIGFTGEDLFARLAAADFPFEANKFGIWQFLWVDQFLGPDRVDFWFPDPWVREAYLQPSARLAGYSGAASTDSYPGFEDEEFYFAYMTLMYDIPTTEGGGKPFVYPKDGQLDIDSLYIDSDPASPVTPMGRVGFPITLSAGGVTSLVVKESRLVGPDGNVETTSFPVGTFGGSAGTLQNTAFILPNEELTPDADYTFTASVETELGSLDVESNFHVSKTNSRPSYPLYTQNIPTTTTGDPTPGTTPPTQRFKPLFYAHHTVIGVDD